MIRARDLFSTAPALNRAQLAIRWNLRERQISDLISRGRRGPLGHVVRLPWADKLPGQRGGGVSRSAIINWENMFPEDAEASNRLLVGVITGRENLPSTMNLAQITLHLALSDNMVRMLIDSGYLLFDEYAEEKVYPKDALLLVHDAIVTGRCTTSKIAQLFTYKNTPAPVLESTSCQDDLVEMDMQLRCKECGSLIGGTVPHAACERDHGKQDFFLTWLDTMREYQERRHGVKYGELSSQPEAWAKYTREHALAAYVELGEFLGWVSWKPWNTPQFPTKENRHEAVLELVDVLFFTGNLLNAMGVTTQELNAAYGEKLARNYVREDHVASYYKH